MGPHDPFAAPTCQKALSVPAPVRDCSTNCCCSKGYLCSCLFSKNSLKMTCSLPYRSNHIFNKLTLNLLQTEWQISLAHTVATPAQVKLFSVCNSCCQPLDCKGLHNRPDTQRRGCSHRSWNATEESREIRAQKGSWKDHRVCRTAAGLSVCVQPPWDSPVVRGTEILPAKRRRQAACSTHYQC